MDLDKDLIQYCIDKDLPTDEMDEEQFKMVNDSCGFNLYKLGILFKKLGKDILQEFKKISN